MTEEKGDSCRPLQTSVKKLTVLIAQSLNGDHRPPIYGPYDDFKDVTGPVSQ